MQQDLILGCSEHIKTLTCALKQMPHFTQRWRGFLGGENLSPWVSLVQTEKFAAFQSRGNEAGNEGMQKTKAGNSFLEGEGCELCEVLLF